MTRLEHIIVVAVLVGFALPAAAQPPRPAETPRAVTLTLAEYNRLIDLASRPPQRPAVAPVPSVLASADLRVRIERETARGVFNLTGQVLHSGLSRVTLLSGATVLDATVAGRPLPLIADGATHAALLPGPGPFAVALDWGAPLTFTPGRASFTLPVPPSGTARVTIDLPGDQADVHLSRGLVTRKSTVAGRTIVEATLDPGAATDVWWSMRDSAPVAAAREARVLADILTLVTLGDSDVRMAALIDVSIVQGEPRTFSVNLPSGYELTAISGSSLESREPRDGSVVLTVGDPSARHHQFLVSLERPHSGGSFALDTAFVSLPDAQRERGEIAIEGTGTLELNATERDGMHRMDVRELNVALHSLARTPVLSAFRYQRNASTSAALSLDVKRFTDSGVLAAVADRAVATTLVTTEGRALTEIALTVQNRAQPFLKVTLPEGASIVSVDVAGQTAKPALGADGTRVPLLRPGFRPNGPYTVTFVYLHAGTPFAKKGEMQMTLPRMDIPVSLVEWEVFAPESYSLRAFDGNMIDRQVYPVNIGWSGGLGVGIAAGHGGGTAGGVFAKPIVGGVAGQIQGRVIDSFGMALPGARVKMERADGSTMEVVTASDGTFLFLNVPSGTVTLTTALDGFSRKRARLEFDQQSQQLEVPLEVGAVSESMTVTADAPVLQVQSSQMAADRARQAGPSQNVINLQRRAAGVLPVRVDVPRAGTSHQFVKPLVVDQEATVTFRYKRR